MKNMSIEKFSDTEKCLIYGDTCSNVFNEIIVSGIMISKYYMNNVYKLCIMINVICFQIILYQIK